RNLQCHRRSLALTANGPERTNCNLKCWVRTPPACFKTAPERRAYPVRKGKFQMLKVEDMSPAEMHALLRRESFGHLGCARDGRPYVVPMNYAYDGKELYFFTTQGMKTQYIDTNPQV